MQQITLLPVKTPLITPKDNIANVIIQSLRKQSITPQNRDIVIIAESAVATTEGQLIDLDSITPTPKAVAIGKKYQIDPRETQLIIEEADEILGGVHGVVLTITKGILSPNAGIDVSNAPENHVTLLPRDPQASAQQIQHALQQHYHCQLAVIISDSRTQPLRLGTVGIAIACSGIEPVEDARGSSDLYGRRLAITRKATADNLTSAAQLLMGEADESIPVVIARGITATRGSYHIPTIPRHECLFFGALGILVGLPEGHKNSKTIET
ncbi:MAG: coenzyme F420-0:L-glutamate ligase [Methanosarcinales archaeon]|uniref:Coenzyme F420-0:L-glutamate ligase n=1 Tax=Candidatus Ethanoperedens thermophilum TaxID=2766897 RepID=A0A848DA58_9EURY|nr:coenzyme F420-0:L-glutamate ligase [Candidatus Ethanoperedens thermophilum]